MPSIFSKHLKSKIFGQEWSFGYNCYEVGHSWTPSCTEAALDVSLAAALNMLPLYALLYSFSQIAIQQKYDIETTWETFKSTIRSASFIFFNAYNGIAFGCFLRNVLGRFYYRALICAPALLASYLAILIEKPARRQALAFYMLNLASEILYRMMVTKGYFRPIKYGETLLFASSLSSWYYLIKMSGFGRDPVSAAMKVLIGLDEAPPRIGYRYSKQSIEESDEGDRYVDHRSTQNDSSSFKKLVRLLNQLRQLYGRSLDSVGNSFSKLLSISSKQACCPHIANTCSSYVFEPIPTRFLLGYSIQTVLQLIGKPIKLYLDPWNTLKTAMTSTQSIRFGLFLASLVSSGRLTSCLLRGYSKSNLAWHSLVSGFIAGLSMFWCPKSSLSMYVMWKAIEQYYLRAANGGSIPLFNFTILSIYATSAATILYTFTLEPRFVRPSYVRIIDKMSNHRLHQVNRMVLDVFGTGSSIGYEDFFPDLHPKYMSNQFKELIFNWMIQPGSA